ncbi:hypothetical protein [Stutzerimonas nitrititolerans]|uniref:hypothetical protein n=1 Tax=Stutzerimonas nitrititolerans TaxID=2482751 RepID=UPI0028B0AFD2|nr:hypothetical protein [Stutzerimonas nitrititolerans]
MIKPTVGRVVHYFPAMLDEGAKPEPGSPLAAIITRVWTDTCINITYFDANGVAFGKTSVLLVHDDQQPAPDGAYVAWMPYQKGQAAKTEALEKAAESCAQNVAIADSPNDLVRLILKPGTTLKINGLPVQLVGEAMVAAHPSNVPMMFCVCEPGEAKSDQDRSSGN